MVPPPSTRDLLHVFTAAVHRTQRAPGPDQVHDLRVAIRRFSQALAISDPDKQVTREIRDRLKRIIKLAGDVRDCDITIKLVSKVNGSKKLLHRLEVRRGAAERRLIAELQKWTAAHLATVWGDDISALHPANPANENTARAIEKLFKRGAAAEKSDAKLHPLRIAAKKLRYTLELVDPDPARLEQIKGLQTKLGNINDYESARRLASEESAGQRVLTRLQQRQERGIRAFRRYWEREFSGRKREWKRAALKSPIRKQAAPSRSPERERQGAA